MRNGILLLLLGLSGLLSAQDLHFSQFNRNPTNLNPALVGAFRGDVRATAMVRSQWEAVPVPYFTTTLLGDAKVKDFGTGILGGGVQLDYDRAGDGDLSWLRVGLSGAYTQQLSDRMFLSAGAQVTLAQRRVDLTALTFGEQFNGDVFDPNRIGESGAGYSAGAASVSAGLNWHVQLPRTRTKLDVGAAGYHLNAPAFNFNAGFTPVGWQPRLSSYLLGVYELNERVDLVGQALYQRQTTYQETLAGSGVRYHLRSGPDRELSVQLTLSHRLNDAVIPALEVRHRMYTGGLSYDINVSGFKRATGGRGGPEFFFQYLLTRVKPPAGLKTCPIF